MGVVLLSGGLVGSVIGVQLVRVLRRLGEGAMATVYRVRHAQLDKVYALKVLNFTGRKTMHERALAEGRVQASLEDVFIAAIRAAGEAR